MLSLHIVMARIKIRFSRSARTMYLYAWIRHGCPVNLETLSPYDIWSNVSNNLECSELKEAKTLRPTERGDNSLWLCPFEATPFTLHEVIVSCVNIKVNIIIATENCLFVPLWQQFGLLFRCPHTCGHLLLLPRNDCVI